MKQLNKKIYFGEDAKQLLVDGITELANSVSVTLGPKGNNVIIEIPGSFPQVTKDGVTVANSINLSHKVKNLGCMLVKNAANKTAREAGDGTTTVTILTSKLASDGLKEIREGVSSVHLKKGMDLACNLAVEHIKKNSTIISLESDYEKIKQIATISANNDEDSGKIVADAVKTVGKDGIVAIQPSKSVETTLETLSGLLIPTGYISENFIIDKTSDEIHFENAYILISEYIIKQVRDVEAVLKKAADDGKQLLILAKEFEQNFVNDMIQNNKLGRLKCCVVRVPQHGETYGLLEDIALYSGATIINGENDIKLGEVKPEVLGKVDSIQIKKTRTIINTKPVDEKAVQDKIALLKKEQEETKSEYYQKVAKSRLARLNGGTAIIWVGANSEIEIEQKMFRIEDAVEAARNSLELGISPGGGVTFLNTTKVLEDYITKNSNDLLEGELRGLQLVKSALKTNITLLCKASSIEVNQVIKEITKKNDKNFGYNFHTESYGDMIEMGVIDPTKVLVTALYNSISVASMVLTGESVVVEEEELI